MALLAWSFLKEDKAQINTAQLKSTVTGLKEAFSSPTLWAVIVFLVFYNFSPSFGTPCITMTDTQFSQSFIGTLGAVASVGSVAWICLGYGKYFTKKTINFQLIFAITTGAIGSFAYLAVVHNSPYASAIMIALNLVFGAAGAIASLTVLGLAGRRQW
ncbi:MAG: hypothetical protein IPI39_25040 [Candidatus Obscuribacter sp.]|nr:hypothetical protein [Candidatus Obscuribacter sp.]